MGLREPNGRACRERWRRICRASDWRDDCPHEQHSQLRTGNGAYWGFTITDGALRMLVVLHFYKLGYDSISIAFLFLFYEFFGIVTNLFGGWIASRSGVKVTLYGGLALQIFALLMLASSTHIGRLVVGRLRDGGAGSVRHRQRLDQDERQERDQSRRA